MCWTLEDHMMTKDSRHHLHEDGALQGSPILVYGGVFEEVFIKHVLVCTIKKGVPT